MLFTFFIYILGACVFASFLFRVVDKLEGRV